MDPVLFAPLLALLPAFCMARARRDGLGLLGGGLLVAGASLKGGELAYAAGVYAIEAFYLAATAASLTAAAAGGAMYIRNRRSGKTPQPPARCHFTRRKSCPAGG